MLKLTLTIAAVLCVIASAQTKPQKTPEAASLFPPSEDGSIPMKRCLNFGSPDMTVGQYLSEGDYIQWKRTPSKILRHKHRMIANTDDYMAYNTQRHEKNIVFMTHVDPAYRYKVTFGFAEIRGYRCKVGNRVMTISAMSESRSGIDVFKTVGCNAAHWEYLSNVRPYPNGNIEVKVRGESAFAALATICFERTGPRDTPRPTPSPSPSKMAMATPTSTSTATPTPTPTSTPSSMPSPTPSPSTAPMPLTVPSTCQQAGCVNLRGPADYKVIGSSLSKDEDREDCSLKSSASASLSIPTGARVVRAILYWSASGTRPSNPTAKLNSQTVSASTSYAHTEPIGSSSNIYFYGAEADVTAAVVAKGSGTYSVSDIPAQTTGQVCYSNAAYAAWTMVVVYEKADLPQAQINVCTENFKFTFPQGTYSSTLKCFASGTKAKTSVVTFESDDYKGEYFYINGQYLGDNTFNGGTAPNLDIKTYDVSNLAQNGVSQITYSFVTYITQTVWGTAVEGLFFPVRVTHTEL